MLEPRRAAGRDELGALTALDLSGCSSLAALPVAIGELSLTTLSLYKCTSSPRYRVDRRAQSADGAHLTECSSLAALPESIAGSGAGGARLGTLLQATSPPRTCTATSIESSASSRIRPASSTATYLRSTRTVNWASSTASSTPVLRRLPRSRRARPGARRPHERQGRGAIAACLKCRRAMQPSSSSAATTSPRLRRSTSRRRRRSWAPRTT